MTTLCHLKAVGRSGSRVLYRCTECAKQLKSSERDPSKILRNCKAGQPRERKPLSDAETTALFGETDPTLIGNRLKEMFDAIGLPECGGCKKRREWLNKAHAWLRGTTPASGS